MTAVLLSVAALYVAFAAAAGAGAALLARLVARSTRLRGSSLVWVSLAIGPLVVALLGTAALVAPSPFAGCHCLTHSHHPHICLLHPTLAEPLLGPALIVVGLWLAAILRGIARQASSLARAARVTRQVRKVAAERVGEADVRLLDCGGASAFTVGTLAPMIVVDRDLWNRLSEPERNAVLHHEQRHVHRADTLTLVALRLCLALQPWLPRGLVDRWRHAAELECDRHAAEHVGSSSAVAQALVSVSRLRAQASPQTLLPDDAAVGVFDGGGIEDRVVALLDGPERPASQRSGANDVLSLMLPALGVIVLILVWPGDHVHHAIETVIGLVSH